MQPTFTRELPIRAEAAIAGIRSAIGSLDSLRNAKAAAGCAEFSIDPSERRFWSPHLSVQFYDTERGSQLFGRFSPRPEVWTFFMMVYFIMVFLMFVGGLYGYVQWLMGGSLWAVVFIPIGAVAIVMLHLASLFGQGLSRDQMEVLQQQFDGTIEFALKNSHQPDANFA